MFSVVLPPPTSPIPTPETPSEVVPRPSPPSKAAPSKFLPPLPPFLPPPPFTPAHPVFVHFASLASARSDSLREAAEEYVAEIVRQQIEEIKSVGETIVNTEKRLEFTSIDDDDEANSDNKDPDYNGVPLGNVAAQNDRETYLGEKLEKKKNEWVGEWNDAVERQHSLTSDHENRWNLLTDGKRFFSFCST